MPFSFNTPPRAKNAGAIAGSNGPEQDPPRRNRGGSFTCRRPAAKGGARPFALALAFSIAVAASLTGCTGAGAEVAAVGRAYRSAVAAQSFTVAADGQRQTVEAGTTIFFRDPAQGALPAAK